MNVVHSSVLLVKKKKRERLSIPTVIIFYQFFLALQTICRKSQMSDSKSTKIISQRRCSERWASGKQLWRGRTGDWDAGLIYFQVFAWRWWSCRRKTLVLMWTAERHTRYCWIIVFVQTDISGKQPATTANLQFNQWMWGTRRKRCYCSL